MSSSEYLCLRTAAAIQIDGDLTKEPWRRAARSPRFGDMVSGEAGYFDTRAAALTERDSLISMKTMWNSSRELAQDGRGVERAAQRDSEFSAGMAARAAPFALYRGRRLLLRV